MKTFVTDDYQITLEDNGGLTVRIIKLLTYDILITYNPDNKEPWAKVSRNGDISISKLSHSITGLGLSTSSLRILHEALETIGKQDLMDNEIVFVNKKNI